MTAAPQPYPPGSDPLLEEIRAIKESISAEFGHDVVRLARQLQKDQEASGRRIIRRKPAVPPTTHPPTVR